MATLPRNLPAMCQKRNPRNVVGHAQPCTHILTLRSHTYKTHRPKLWCCRRLCVCMRLCSQRAGKWCVNVMRWKCMGQGMHGKATCRLQQASLRCPLIPTTIGEAETCRYLPRPAHLRLGQSRSLPIQRGPS